ncbi:hypothetical protein NL676_012329 [Syzygium grande]|nr:hypothetical protein NL676_012329 [Syzygium grande]
MVELAVTRSRRRRAQSLPLARPPAKRLRRRPIRAAMKPDHPGEAAGAGEELPRPGRAVKPVVTQSGRR